MIRKYSETVVGLEILNGYYHRKLIKIKVTFHQFSYLMFNLHYMCLIETVYGKLERHTSSREVKPLGDLEPLGMNKKDEM